MPFTFLAHQAPVLPLKLWRPRWFSGAALAIGSMAPDFDKFLDGPDASRYGHTLAGQVVYCLPLSLVIYWLLTRIAAPPLARFLPDLGALHLRDYAASLATVRPRHEWLLVATSVLVGSASHVAFDGFTHADPRVVALFPFLGPRAVAIGGRSYSLLTVLQVVATVAGAAFTLGLMRAIGRKRRVLAWSNLDPASVPARAERSPAAIRYWSAVAVLTVGGAGALALLHLALAGWTRFPGLGYAVALRLPVVGFAALCLAALVVRWPAWPAASPVSRTTPPRRSRLNTP